MLDHLFMTLKNLMLMLFLKSFYNHRVVECSYFHYKAIVATTLDKELATTKL